MSHGSLWCRITEDCIRPPQGTVPCAAPLPALSRRRLGSGRLRRAAAGRSVGHGPARARQDIRGLSAGRHCVPPVRLRSRPAVSRQVRGHQSAVGSAAVGTALGAAAGAAIGAASGAAGPARRSGPAQACWTGSSVGAQQCRRCLWWSAADLRRQLHAVHDRPRRHRAGPRRLGVSYPGYPYPAVSISRLPVSTIPYPATGYYGPAFFGPVSHDRLRRRMGVAWRRRLAVEVRGAEVAGTADRRYMGIALASHCRASRIRIGIAAPAFAP